jgi:hypothetical protein
MKFIKFLLKFIFNIQFISSIKLQQGPFDDNQWRQANVPPVVAVMFDVPSYGKTELFKWNDFIQANTQKIYENKKKNSNDIDTAYRDRLNRIALLKSKIG